MEKVVVEAKESPPPEPSIPEEPTGFATVVSRERFAGEAVDAAALILQAPGATVRRTSGMETLGIRGATPDETLVLLDGIRIQSVAGGGVDLTTIPAGLLRSVTVLRGNEGGRYGAGALGGVVLLETRPPDAGRLAPYLTLTGGSFATGSFDATVAGGDPSLSGIAGLELSTTQGNYSASYDPTPASPGQDVQNVDVTNNRRAGASLLLEGRAVTPGGLHLDGLLQGFTEDRGLPGTFYSPTPDDRRLSRRGLAAIRVSSNPAEAMSAEGGLELRRENLLVTHSGAAGIQGLPGGDGWQQETVVTARARTEVAPASFTLLSAEVSTGSEALESPYHGSHSRAVLSASAADELYLGRSVTVAPAIRVDRVGPFTGLSPRLGVAYRPWTFLELRTSAGRSFRAPSFGELYLEQGPVKPNPDLRPEQGSMIEAGALLRFGVARVQVVGFASRITDAISYEQGGGVVKPFNFPGAEIDGGEVEAVVHPAPFATVTAIYGLARTRNLSEDPRFFGKELPFRPAERAGIRAEARRGGLEGFAEYGWQSLQYTSRTDRTLLPCQRAARLGAGVRVAETPWDVWASAELDDLFDYPLIDELGFPQPGRAFFFTLRSTPSGAGPKPWSSP